MGRKLQVEWQESVEQLQSMYKAERDSQNRQRLQALWLVRNQQTLKATARVIGVHERTVQEWVTWYRNGGVRAVLSKRNGGQGGPRAWLNTEQEQALRAQADAGAFRAIAEAVDWVKQSFQIQYSYWGMRSVFDRLQLKKKVPRPSNPKASAAAQEAWKKGG